MGNFNFISTGFKDLWVIEPKVYGDSRGFFMETYNKQEFSAQGIAAEFVQDNRSLSQKGVLRGLHFQKEFPQAKLVRVMYGRVYDVVVDLRKGEPTFKKWFGIELSEENKTMLYIPKGFAHGFLTLSERADFLYKCTEFYHPEDEGGIFWADPELKITWPEEIAKENLIISDKDKKLPLLTSVLR